MAFYDDPQFSYPKFWVGRDYEHKSEILALRRLLGRRHFVAACDIGAGFGRLTQYLAQFADQVFLIEPAAKQRRLVPPIGGVQVLAGTSTHTGLASASVDLVTVIRVLHHLPDPRPTLGEIHRILKPGGWLVLEFANSTHFKARLTGLVTGQAPHTLRRRAKTIPFVNHHPQSILTTLARCHFEPLAGLSVSNFRLPLVKKIVPLRLLLILESLAQPLLAGLYFGPSIWILARRLDKPTGL